MSNRKPTHKPSVGKKKPTTLDKYLATVHGTDFEPDEVPPKVRRTWLSEEQGATLDANARRYLLGRVLVAEFEDQKTKGLKHGQIEKWKEKAGKRYGRTVRWVSTCMTVATRIDKLRADSETPFPISVLDRSWRNVPKALRNVAAGRKPDEDPAPKPPRKPTIKSRTKSWTAKLNKMVTEAETFGDDGADAITALRDVLQQALADLNRQVSPSPTDNPTPSAGGHLPGDEETDGQHQSGEPDAPADDLEDAPEGNVEDDSEEPDQDPHDDDDDPSGGGGAAPKADSDGPPEPDDAGPEDDQSDPEPNPADDERAGDREQPDSGPTPNTPGGEGQGFAPTNGDASRRIIEKIKKALALAQDQDGKPEGELAASVARKLMRRHRVTVVDLEVDSQATDPMQRHEFELEKQQSWRRSLAHAVAKHCGCFSLHEFNSRKMTLFGPEAATAVAEYLYTVTVRGVEQEMDEHMRAIKKTEEWAQMPIGQKRTERHRFGTWAVEGIRTRLAEMRQEEVKGDPTGSALMKSSLQDAERWAKENGERWTNRGSGWVEFSSEGYDAGGRVPLHSGLKDRKDRKGARAPRGLLKR